MAVKQTVDHEGEILEGFVTKTRDKKAEIIIFVMLRRMALLA